MRREKTHVEGEQTKRAGGGDRERVSVGSGERERVSVGRREMERESADRDEENECR